MKITYIKNKSKIIFNLCKKISGVLAAVLLIISLSAIGNHSTVNAVKLPYTKEGLIELLSEEWISFWNAVDDDRAVDVEATWRTSVELAMKAINNIDAWSAANAAAWEAVRALKWSPTEDIPSSTVDAAWNSAFAKTWKAPNGRVYRIIGFNQSEYFENLIMILRNQTEMLRGLVKRLRV